MKIKTRTAAKKRIRFTGTGKVKIMKAARKHLLQQKSNKQKRKGKTGNSIMLSPADMSHIRRALPNR